MEMLWSEGGDYQSTKEIEVRSKGGSLLYKTNGNLTYTLPRLAVAGIRVSTTASPLAIRQLKILAIPRVGADVLCCSHSPGGLYKTMITSIFKS